jgi:hypothetical protein
LLAKEPLPLKGIERVAKEQSIRFARDHNHAQASVSNAADRLGVVGLKERGAGRQGSVWWALPRRWDSARFQPLASAYGMDLTATLRA